MAQSRLVNRNVVNGPARTSMRLEPELWDAFGEVCRREDIHSSELIRRAALAQPIGGRTSAVRVFVLEYFRNTKG